MEVHYLQKDNDIIWVKPTVNGAPLKMELDKGAALTVISKDDFTEHFGKAKYDPTKRTFRTYSGEKLFPLGIFEAGVKVKDSVKHLPLYIVKTGGPPLFGSVWMDAFFCPTWFKDIRVDAVDEAPPEKGPTPEKSVNDLLSKYQDVFTKNLENCEISNRNLP